MFENQIIRGTHATRYIASWIKSGGGLKYGEDIDNFTKWLKSLGLSEADVSGIKWIATNGKMELEHSAKQFLTKK